MDMVFTAPSHILLHLHVGGIFPGEIFILHFYHFSVWSTKGGYNRDGFRGMRMWCFTARLLMSLIGNNVVVIELLFVEICFWYFILFWLNTMFSDRWYKSLLWVFICEVRATKLIINIKFYDKATSSTKLPVIISSQIPHAKRITSSFSFSFKSPPDFESWSSSPPSTQTGVSGN